MTENEWTDSTNPMPMLDFLRDRASPRKLRLFAVACCRQVWHLLPKEVRKVVQAAERYAEGLIEEEVFRQRGDRNASKASLKDGDYLAFNFVRRMTHSGEADLARYAAVDAAYLLSRKEVQEAGLEEDWRNPRFRKWPKGGDLLRRRAHYHRLTADTIGLEQVTQAELLRCIIGPLPFRSVELSPAVLAWNGGIIPNLAQAIHEEQRFEDLPILADALEEAGCTNTDILSHCRQSGNHVRGCWPLDLVLDKQ
jgi:hypothetical protein